MDKVRRVLAIILVCIITLNILPFNMFAANIIGATNANDIYEETTTKSSLYTREINGVCEYFEDDDMLLIFANGTTDGDTYAYFNEPENVEIGTEVTELLDDQFSAWYKVKSIVFRKESKVESIGDIAFGDAQITEIEIPESVKTMGDGVFDYTEYIESIVLPGSVVWPHTDDISHLHTLKEISFSSDNPNYSAIDNVLYNNDVTKLLGYPPSREGNYFYLPSTVITIDDSMNNIGDNIILDFRDATNLSIVPSDFLVNADGSGSNRYMYLPDKNVDTDYSDVLNNLAISNNQLIYYSYEDNEDFLDGITGYYLPRETEFEKNNGFDLTQYLPYKSENALVTGVTDNENLSFSTYSTILSVDNDGIVSGIAKEAGTTQFEFTVDLDDAYKPIIDGNVISNDTLVSTNLEINVEEALTSDELDTLNDNNSMYFNEYQNDEGKIPNKEFNTNDDVRSVITYIKQPKDDLNNVYLNGELLNSNKYIVGSNGTSEMTIQLPQETLVEMGSGDYTLVATFSEDDSKFIAQRFTIDIKYTDGGDGYYFDTDTGSLLVSDDKGSTSWKNDISSSDIKEVEIDDAVTYISDNAFEDCANLTTVNFESGSTLNTIGDSAFAGTSSLNAIEIPSSVTDIGTSAFEGSGITTVSFESGSSLNTIGDSAFAYTSSLSDIEIPNSFIDIGTSAFEGSSVTTVSFEAGSSLNTIGNNAFANTSSLSVIEIPSSVTDIGASAFEGSSIMTVGFEAGSTLSTIGDNAFANTLLLNDIEIPSSVTDIGISAFEGSGITTVSFESGSPLNTIGDSAFAYTSSLSDIEIPSSVTDIGTSAFEGSSITTVGFEDGSSLNTIGDRAFADTSLLNDIEIPNSVTDIGISAFEGSSVTTVGVESGSTLNTIGNRAFADTSSLGDIEIPSSVTGIGVSAFEGSGITSINIPKLIYISDLDAVFGDDNNLESYVVDADNTYYSGVDGILYNNDVTEIISYPDKKTGTEYILPSTVEVIDSNVFDNPYLSKIDMTEALNLSTIDQDSFYRNNATQKLEILVSEELSDTGIMDTLNYDSNTVISVVDDGGSSSGGGEGGSTTTAPEESEAAGSEVIEPSESISPSEPVASEIIEPSESAPVSPVASEVVESSESIPSGPSASEIIPTEPIASELIPNTTIEPSGVTPSVTVAPTAIPSEAIPSASSLPAVIPSEIPIAISGEGSSEITDNNSDESAEDNGSDEDSGVIYAGTNDNGISENNGSVLVDNAYINQLSNLTFDNEDESKESTENELNNENDIDLSDEDTNESSESESSNETNQGHNSEEYIVPDENTEITMLPTDEDDMYYYDYDGDTPFEIRIDIPMDQFENLYLEGELLVRGEDYTVREGSTILTVNADNFDGFDSGVHNLKAEFKGGDMDVDFMFNNTLKINYWKILVAASILVIILSLAVYLFKFERNKEALS